MYEELITALRKRAHELPERFSKNALNIDLFLKAADVIEELSAKYSKALGDLVKQAHIVTNADRIRSMTDEELAEIMVSDCPPNYPKGECREYEKNDGNLDCSKCWLDWLKQEVSNDECR